MRRFLFLLCLPLCADQLPKLEGENLNGKPVEIAEAAAGHPAILVIGFTHGSQKQTQEWSRRLTQEFPDPAQVKVYSVAVLEDAPRLVRGMAVHGMKSGVPKEQRDRFVVLYHHEADLKRLVSFERPDDAYLLVVDRSGAIRYRMHGAANDSSAAELKTQVRALDPK